MNCRSLRKMPLSRMSSPRSLMTNLSVWAPGVNGQLVRRVGVNPSYCMFMATLVLPTVAGSLVLLLSSSKKLLLTVRGRP